MSSRSLASAAPRRNISIYPLTGTHEQSGYSFQVGPFQLDEGGEHFINPCCFGEDLAAWLLPKLSAKNIETAQPYQEDWGWELPAKYGPNSYYLSMSGNADGPGNDEGEWHIIVEKRRSILERLMGKGKIAGDDPLVIAVEEILSAEPSIRNVRTDE